MLGIQQVGFAVQGSLHIHLLKVCNSEYFEMCFPLFHCKSSQSLAGLSSSYQKQTSAGGA